MKPSNVHSLREAVDSLRAAVVDIQASQAALVGRALSELKGFERWKGVEEELYGFVLDAAADPGFSDDDDASAVYPAAVEAFRCANAERIAAARLVESDKTNLEMDDLDWVQAHVFSAAAAFGAFDATDAEAVVLAIQQASGLPAGNATIEDIRQSANHLPLTRWRVVWYLSQAVHESRWRLIAEERKRANTLRISARVLENQMDLARIASVGGGGEVFDARSRRLPGVVLTPFDNDEYIKTLDDAIPHFSSYLVPETLRWICDSARLAYAEHITHGTGPVVTATVTGGLREVLRLATGNDDPPPTLVANNHKLWRVMRGLAMPGLPQGMDATIIQWWEEKAHGFTRPKLTLTYPPSVLPNFGRLMKEAGKDSLKRQTALPPWPRIVSRKPNLRAAERWLWWRLAIMFRDRAMQAAREGGVQMLPEDESRAAGGIGVSVNQLRLTLSAWVESGDLVQRGPSRYAFGDSECWEHIVEAGQLEVGGRVEGRKRQAQIRGRLIKQGILEMGL